MSNEQPPTLTNNQLKVSDATKRVVLVKMIERNAFKNKSAIKEVELNLEGEEIYAFKQLVELEEIIEVQREGEKYYHLAERFKFFKSYRKEVVKGLSISVLLFIILLLLAAIVSIIYQFITN